MRRRASVGDLVERECFDGATSPLVRASTLLAGLFDEEVAAAEYHALGDPAWLLPSERSALGTVSGKRLAEFAAGRACARLALHRLGMPRTALPPLDDRCPAWPASVAGSISHAAGFCAAVVAPRRLYRALGIDIEVVDDVESAIWPQLLTPAEHDTLRTLPLARQRDFAALVFSAKEAFYKCQYPVHRQWFEFRDVCVEVDAGDGMDRGVFSLLVGDPPAGMPLRWTGRYVRHERWIVTGVGLRG